MSDLGVAVIGTGFIGTVHLEALRRIGAQVRGVLGSSAERGEERGRALGVASYGSLAELLADESVEVVHVTSPNQLHFEQVRTILAAGKHVVCEKPLAMTSAQSGEMVRLAARSRTVAAVCYNTRFYPLSQHARGMVEAGELGEVRLVTGRYHQDWLARERDWNWRLLPEAGGALRAVGDIGTHWLDLTSFIVGMAPSEVFADLATFIPERERPVGPVETFSRAQGATERIGIGTEDAGLILLRYPNGARGAVTVSQVSHGRKNAMAWEITGSEATAAFESDAPDRLWIGRRDEPNMVLDRDPGLMNARGAAAAVLPGGHVEGFADTFAALFRQVHRDARAGGRQADSAWATFEDGHREMLLCDAILRSARDGRWARVEDDA